MANIAACCGWARIVQLQARPSAMSTGTRRPFVVKYRSEMRAMGGRANTARIRGKFPSNNTVLSW